MRDPLNPILSLTTGERARIAVAADRDWGVVEDAILAELVNGERITTDIQRVIRKVLP